MSATAGTISLRSEADPTRRTARIVGVLFIITFLASIPGALLYTSILEPNAIIGSSGSFPVALGALLEMITGIAGIGTAIFLFPVLKRQNEAFALGYVATRVVETTIIIVGAISLLSLVTLQQAFEAGGGADRATFVVAGTSLVAVKDWTFLFGPAFCAGIGNGLILGYLMFKSGLVPRRWAILGLIGGTMAVLTATAVLFGLYEQVSAPSFLMTVPEIVWEGFLGIYLIAKGFKKSPIRDAYARSLTEPL